jgi:NADH-quinone oxidoreductase subunit L
MEGPTPISALIHAATMVTAGIFMVARMSPLFELSQTALNFVLFIGATTAFWTGLIGIVQNDIKRVVAYSTLSQLGYMTVALGVSAYSAAVYHLMTHAFFKALLFLAAGSVIIGMHHEQDMRRMGGLRTRMPITFWTSLIGTLALVGTPFFAGFYSKDTIIEAAAEHAREAHNWVATYGYWSVLLGAFVTALYSFRLMYLTFAGKPRWDAGAAHGEHSHADVTDAAHVASDDPHHAHDEVAHHDDHGHGHGHEPHESPWVVTIPLILLAIPSAIIGFLTIGPMLFGTDMMGKAKQLPFFLGSIDVAPAHDAVGKLAEEFHGPFLMAWHGMAWHGWLGGPFWLALAGFLVATVFYWWKPELHGKAREFFSLPVRILQDKYGMDALWIDGFAGGGVQLGKASRVVDEKVIDGAVVNGSVRLVDIVAGVLRVSQSGYLYHYAFAMILGLIAMLGMLMWWSP